jgi:hypothetical protein
MAVQDMIAKHDHKKNKSTIEFNVGDNITVKIPRIDRAGTAFPRLPGKVYKISQYRQKFYHIITQWGILKDKYRACDLEPYSGLINNVNIENIEKTNTLSLTEAARLQGVQTGQQESIVKVCNCTGVCKGDGRCSCWSFNGGKCGSHCHLKMPKGKNKKCKNCK